MAIITGLLAGGAAIAAGATVGTAITAAGLGLSAGAAYQGAQADKRNAAFQRDMAKTNQEIAEQNARDVELRGRQAVFDQRRSVARSLSSVRAATAGSGLTVDEAGTTPADLVQSMVESGELDVLRLRNNIEREKRRALVQGAAFEAQAEQFELQRGSISPFRSGLGAGIGGLSQNDDLLALMN